MQHVNRSSKARNSSLLAVSMSSSTAQPLLQAPVYTKTHCIKLRNIYLMKLTFASKYAHTMPGLRVKRPKIRFLKNKQKRRRCIINHHHVVCFYMPAEVLTRWKNRPPPSSANHLRCCCSAATSSLANSS